MGLFNACPPTNMPADGALTFDSMRENGDAVNSLIPPEPYIPTLQEKVYANYFPGKTKNLWTIWNKSGKDLNQALIEVPFKENVSYIEVLNDVIVKTKTTAGKTQLTVPVKNNEVVCIIEVPKLISARVIGNTIKISFINEYQSGYKLQIARQKDIPGKRQEINFTHNGISINKSNKMIIKLIKDYYLIDEIVIN
jgi:hypothetical protein